MPGVLEAYYVVLGEKMQHSQGIESGISQVCVVSVCCDLQLSPSLLRLKLH